MGTGSSGSRRSPRARRRRPTVSVLRVGHRPGRDPRLTTHVALVARAFGAERLFLHPPDNALGRRLEAVGREWGGSFRVLGVTDWKSLVRGFPGASVHLTMYGEPIDRVLPRVKEREILAIVGGAKVPPELYRLATYNIAVGPQPHSEVAALAILLERLNGLPGPKLRAGAKRVIVPQARGKKVVAVARNA